MSSIQFGMRRIVAILLLLSVAALGSGGMRYVHERAHAAADAHARAEHHHEHRHDAGPGHAEAHDHHHGDQPAGGHRPGHGPVDDPADCFIHAQLNLPLHDAGYVPVLACLGRFVAFPPARPAPAVRSRRPALLLDSRGPPPRVTASLSNYRIA